MVSIVARDEGVRMSSFVEAELAANVGVLVQMKPATVDQVDPLPST